MWLGRHAFTRHTICDDIEIQWVTQMKLLGVLFTPHCKNISDENITCKVDKMKCVMNMWQGRCLTVVGKIAIVKTLLLSQITHLLASLPNPSAKVMKDLRDMLFNFVWGSKRNPVSRRRLCQSVLENGLEMVDLDSYLLSLKIKWSLRNC